MDKERRIKNGTSKLLFFGFLLSFIGVILAFMGPLVAGFSLTRGGDLGDLPLYVTVILSRDLLYIAVICFLMFGVAVTVNTVHRVLSFALKGERLNFYEKGEAIMALIFIYITFFMLRPETFHFMLGELSR